MRYNDQNGFTIVELMIAIAVFSVAITMVTAGVIQVGRFYQQGVAKSKIISLSREIQSNVSQNYQYSGRDPTIEINNIPIGGQTYSALCIGITRYLYITGTSEFYIEEYTNPPTCNSTIIKSDAQKPLPSGARVTRFDFAPSVGLMASFTSRFVIGADDLFETGPDATHRYNNSCELSAGREFCSVVEFDSEIVRKVN